MDNSFSENDNKPIYRFCQTKYFWDNPEIAARPEVYGRNIHTNEMIKKADGFPTIIREILEACYGRILIPMLPAGMQKEEFVQILTSAGFECVSVLEPHQVNHRTQLADRALWDLQLREVWNG